MDFSVVLKKLVIFGGNATGYTNYSSPFHWNCIFLEASKQNNVFNGVRSSSEIFQNE